MRPAACIRDDDTPTKTLLIPSFKPPSPGQVGLSTVAYTPLYGDCMRRRSYLPGRSAPRTIPKYTGAQGCRFHPSHGRVSLGAMGANKSGYFFRKNIRMGMPSKLKFSRKRFSKNRRYGSLTYCGKLQKNANATLWVGNCIMYLIFTLLPL